MGRDTGPSNQAKMKYHPDEKEFNVLCESLQKDVTRCCVHATDIGAGPGGNDKFFMTLQFSDKSLEYIYFSQRFAAEEWYQRFSAKIAAQNSAAQFLVAALKQR